MGEVLAGQAEHLSAVMRRVSYVYSRRMKCIASLPIFCDNLK